MEVNRLKRFIIVMLAALTLLSSVIAQPKKPDIRFGGQFYPEDFLLKGNDFFGKYGITVSHTIFSSGTENNEALISGNIDIGVGSDSKTAALFNAIGDQALIIGTVQRGNRYSTMVRKDAAYKDWAELKGKKVATRFGTGAEFVLRKYFDTRKDVAWTDFQWINMKTEDMIAALDRRQIEAFTMWAPTGEISEAEGIAKPMRLYGDVALTPVFIHTTKKFVEKNRPAVVRFLAGMLDKAEMITKDVPIASKYAAEAAKKMNYSISAEAFGLIFRRIDFRIEYDNAIIEELIDTAEYLKKLGMLDKVPAFIYDTSLIEEARKLRSK